MVSIEKSAFYFFELLPSEIAGGRRPLILMEKGKPTLYKYKVRSEAKCNFFNTAKDAGYHFFLT